MYACLAVTCHLHFWQNDRDFLRATVVTRGWNGYRNKSQHRKSTLEKKILPPFQQGFEPATFQSRVRRSNHWAVPAPPTNHRAYTELDCRLARAGSPSTLSRLPSTEDRDWFSRPALTSVTYGQRWVQGSGSVWKSRQPYGFCGRKAGNTESCTCIGHSLSLICQSDIRGH